MGLGWQHILLFALVAFLLFGRGKISELMGDVAKGVKAFKKGLSEDDTPAETASSPKTIEHNAAVTATTPGETKKV